MVTLPPMLDPAVDHTAIAVRDIAAAVPLVRDALGGAFLFAGDVPAQGFRWAQFGMPGGGKIELVMPLRADSFLARFIERRGEGVHHITLKVPDIAAAVEHLEAQGVPLFNVSIGGKGWKEAFIHPRDAHGTLIQLAETPWSDEDLARHHLADHEGSSHQHLSLGDLLDPARPRVG